MHDPHFYSTLCKTTLLIYSNLFVGVCHTWTHRFFNGGSLGIFVVYLDKCWTICYSPAGCINFLLGEYFSSISCHPKIHAFQNGKTEPRLQTFNRKSPPKRNILTWPLNKSYFGSFLFFKKQCNLATVTSFLHFERSMLDACS